jgi:hypothetical protein
VRNALQETFPVERLGPRRQPCATPSDGESEKCPTRKQLKKAEISVKLAPTIGTAVDHRRRERC